MLELAWNALTYYGREYRFFEDDDRPLGGRHQRRAQRPPRGQVRLQFQRPLWPRRPDSRALRRACSRIEAVLDEIGSRAQLSVDASGRFDLEIAIAYAKMLRDYPLFWYEEAGDPLDFQLQATLAQFYPRPMATGKNLFSHQDARQR